MLGGRTKAACCHLKLAFFIYVLENDINNILCENVLQMEIVMLLLQRHCNISNYRQL